VIQSLYTSVSGMVVGMWQQARIAHNLTNADTVGYKAIRAPLSEFASLLSALLTDPTLSEAGVGAMIGSEETDFSQGPLQLTNRQLDVALNGPGFLRVMTPSGERFTRVGHLHRDASGRLVTAHSYAVLGQNGPVELPPGDIAISLGGEIFVDGQSVAFLALAEFEEPELSLQRVGGTVYAAREGAVAIPGANTRVMQGSLEASNVNLASEMTNLIATSRLYQLCQRLTVAQDEILRQTSNELGRL